MDDFDFYAIQDENTRKLVSRLLNQVFRLSAELKDTQLEIRRLNEIQSDVQQLNVLYSNSQADLQRLNEIQNEVQRLSQLQSSSQADLQRLNEIQAEVRRIGDTQANSHEQIQKLIESQSQTQTALEKLEETQSGMQAALERLGDIQSDIQRLMLAQIQIQRLLDAQSEAFRVSSIRAELQQLREEVNLLASGAARREEQIVDVEVFPEEKISSESVTVEEGLPSETEPAQAEISVSEVSVEEDLLSEIEPSLPQIPVSDIVGEEMQPQPVEEGAHSTEVFDTSQVQSAEDGFGKESAAEQVLPSFEPVAEFSTRAASNIAVSKAEWQEAGNGQDAARGLPEYLQKRRKLSFPWQRFDQKLALQMFVVSLVFLAMIVSVIFISRSGTQIFTGGKTSPQQATDTLPVFSPPTLSPSPLPAPTSTPVPTATLPALSSLSVALDSNVPLALRQSVGLPPEVKQVEDADAANIHFGVVSNGQAQSRWVYALVAPFPTIIDEVTLDALKGAWSGTGQRINGQPLFITEATLAVFEALWGKPNASNIVVVPEARLLDQTWVKPYSWAIVPFEALDPRWKVIRVDGQSPLDKAFEEERYPLAVPFGWRGDEGSVYVLTNQAQPSLLRSNRDADKMTTLVMTGTTSLIRAVAARMEEKGLTYPGGDIQPWLKEADLTHVSNEVAFDPNCPRVDFHKDVDVFCSRSEYIELLKFVGVDIVELTGNHLMDFGWRALSYTLDLYTQNGIRYFGGGINAEEAWKPLKIEHNGNKLAFVGCSASGPQYVWATDSQPGAAQCDINKMVNLVTALRSEGYLPIVTFQHYESYGFYPVPQQRDDFDRASQAGAVVVSGSQAHFPQIMTFIDDRFVHYGLGNLFFDQMDIPVKGTRREFIDRHVFYDGRYISTELLTAMLEDYSRPRPMDRVERESLLTDIFAASGW
ncbi:MAG: hypothetical protein HPY45_06610 [Anaerolineae bacterium]|nr:hypothetical protein [Anaerolineae bacterium]